MGSNCHETSVTVSDFLPAILSPEALLTGIQIVQILLCITVFGFAMVFNGVVLAGQFKLLIVCHGKSRNLPCYHEKQLNPLTKSANLALLTEGKLAIYKQNSYSSMKTYTASAGYLKLQRSNVHK